MLDFGPVEHDAVAEREVVVARLVSVSESECEQFEECRLVQKLLVVFFELRLSQQLVNVTITVHVNSLPGSRELFR